MSSAVVLSSGGINSAVVLEIALRTHRPDPVHMLSFKYRSKSNDQECLASLDLYHYYLDRGENVTWEQIELPDLFNKDSPSSFLYATMLSVAATYAIINEARYVYTGMLIQDMYEFTFNFFLESMGDVIYKGSDNKVELRGPVVGLKKADVIKKAYDLEVPLNLAWSCNSPKVFTDDSCCRHCGTCSSCKERIGGFDVLRVVDPVDYAVKIEWNTTILWPYIGEKQLRAGKL